MCKSPVDFFLKKTPTSIYPKYLDSFLKPKRSVYHTERSQDGGVVLEVLYFALSV